MSGGLDERSHLPVRYTVGILLISDRVLINLMLCSRNCRKQKIQLNICSSDRQPIKDNLVISIFEFNFYKHFLISVK